MKTIILILAGVFYCQNTFAQIPNASFEDTVVVNDLSYATGWTNDPYGSGVTTDSYSGTFAAQVWNWYTYVRGFMISGNGPVILTTPGEPVTDPGVGTSISSKPTHLRGYYKYVFGDVMDPDSGLIQVTMKHNSNVIGFGEVRLDSVSNFTEFMLEIAYSTGDMPDTIIVVLRSSVNGYCANSECFYLTVDDLALITSSGVEPFNMHSSKVFPNPASDMIIIDHRDLLDANSIRIYSMSGNQMNLQTTVGASSTQIDLSGLTPGMYVYHVCNSEGMTLSNGKFIVKE